MKKIFRVNFHENLAKKIAEKRKLGDWDVIVVTQGTFKPIRSLFNTFYDIREYERIDVPSDYSQIAIHRIDRLVQARKSFGKQPYRLNNKANEPKNANENMNSLLHFRWWSYVWFSITTGEWRLIEKRRLSSVSKNIVRGDNFTYSDVYSYDWWLT